MALGGTATTINWFDLLGRVFEQLRPLLPMLVLLVVLALVIACPLPGRGPGPFARRDPWRTYKYDARRAVLARAGHRCEGSVFLGWGRCSRDAEEVDHIYPWSRGGATVVSNGQALCRNHNRRKSNLTPPWWYVLSLERRRRTYVPTGYPIRVSASMTAPDRALRRTDEPSRRR